MQNMMKKILIKNYFEQEMKNSGRTVINPQSLLIIGLFTCLGLIKNRIYLANDKKPYLGSEEIPGQISIEEWEQIMRITEDRY